ncbi:MAG: hypothetical protein U0167_07890 [bacterium]
MRSVSVKILTMFLAATTLSLAASPAPASAQAGVSAQAAAPAQSATPAQVAPPQAAAPAAIPSPADPLSPLDFLIGDWQGEGGGTPGRGAGPFTFARSLQDRVIVRTSSAEYPGTPGRPAAHHDDLMVIYVGEGGEIRADYYDSEGHVIRYGVTITPGKEAVFAGDALGGTSRFRLTYTLQDDGALKGRFEMGFPDQPSEIYTEYLSWTARRVTKPAAGAAAASTKAPASPPAVAPKGAAKAAPKPATKGTPKPPSKATPAPSPSAGAKTSG